MEKNSTRVCSFIIRSNVVQLSSGTNQPVKHKTKREKPPAKRKQTEGEQTKPVKPSAKKVKTLPKTQTKPTVKRSRKAAVYKAKVIRFQVL